MPINGAPRCSLPARPLPVGIQYWDRDAKELQSPNDETTAVPASFCSETPKKQGGRRDSDPVTQKVLETSSSELCGRWLKRNVRRILPWVLTRCSRSGEALDLLLRSASPAPLTESQIKS
jgi:hypothetical protein